MRQRNALILWLCLAAPVWGQGPAAEPNGGEGASLPLKAELRTTRAVYDPASPIWLSFTLRNESDAVVELPLMQADLTANGLGLPLELIAGTREQPALSVVYQHEPATPIKPAPPVEGKTLGSAAPSSATPGGGATATGAGQPAAATLRIAARGALGADVDLRSIYHAVRYAGVYKLSWKPLGARVAAAEVEFRVEGAKDAIVVTDLGKLTFKLAYDKAPHNVENFLDLVRSAFYDGKSVHRIIPGFVLQGGCPNANGTGMRPDGKTIAAELNETPFTTGTLVMAHKKDDADSASCQFFIALQRLPELDGKYTVIGQASDEESMRTLQQIASQPTDTNGKPIRTVTIRSVNLVDVRPNGSPAVNVNARP